MRKRSVWPLASFVLLVGATDASAQTLFESHTGARMDAGATLDPAGSYGRVSSEEGRRGYAWAGGVDIAVHHIFESALGIGAHLGGSVWSVNLPLVNDAVVLVDVGPSILARLSWGRLEATLRFPFGVSLLSARGTEELEGPDGQTYFLRTLSNDVGLGFHASGLVGTTHWLRENLALTLACGPTFHWLVRDEIYDVRVGPPPNLMSVGREARDDVVHHAMSFSLRVGMSWGATER